MNKTLITNPIMWADVPDVDPIRVGSCYYMVSTSMHSMPGCPIMRSTDLKHWEIVSYVYDTFEDNEAHRLENGKNIYGKGSWAASLRHHNDTFYVCFSSNDTRRFYVYRTKDVVNGPWERSVIDGLRHDPGLLFDEGRVFVFSGNGSIYITELTADATAVKPGGIDQLLFETEREDIGLRCEGCHAYRLNGYYYLLFIEWPRTGNMRRRQICYRSKELLGPYERRIVLDDDLGYHNKGVAQGGLLDTPNGEWYAMLFQDHDAVGRIPCLVPVAWEDDWPVFGIDGKVPEQFEVGLPESESMPLVISDEFDYQSDRLARNWQWNHNPDNRLWSVTERPGYLRLRTGSLADSVVQARNTLTQRTEGPACTGETLLDTAHMKPGDRAGLVALQSHYGTVGVAVADNGEKFITMCVNGGAGEEKVLEACPFDGSVVHLKIHFDFEDSIDQAVFYYSMDGTEWAAIGEPLQMKYTLDHFMGYRIGLYQYATREIGGCADFDYFRYQRYC
ncbi:glycoside hydrolase [Paenibacillus nanensis]|uniref:Glycoside hydrolase n=1 Tax=Paenibacillus nanensis TaxID=393251 RepID=A0A3A1VF45_9BACL|nr:glycoside hydrolase 43 family protein [Paenibacillus nanensis]RIX59197.1 glycoside hydrolase [Paenibacillus nanensis]